MYNIFCKGLLLYGVLNVTKCSPYPILRDRWIGSLFFRDWPQKREQTYKKYFKQKNRGWVEKKHRLLTVSVGISSIQVDMKLEVNAIRIRISGKIPKLLSFLLKNWNQIGGPQVWLPPSTGWFFQYQCVCISWEKVILSPSSSLSSGWTRCLWHWQKHLCKSDDSNGQ